MRRLVCGLILSLGFSISAALAAPAPAGLEWVGWSDAVFARAKREHRLVILDLEAVWCHWCHVMAETTYRDPQVVRDLRAHFIAVRVDQDARPDLSNRYEDYGWPATVVYDADGREIVKLSGYVPPPRMRSLLRAIIADPTPGPSVTEAERPAVQPASAAALPPGRRAELARRVVDRYDADLGGWSTVHKYLDWDAVEYCLGRARSRDAGAERMARQTLDAQLQLVDPVWGGVYQYSDGGVWTNPHFEKIMQMQAEDMRVYAQAAAQLGDARYLEAARAIHRYLRAFLRSGAGVFYTSQDADLVPGEHSADYYALGDAGRRARGVPRVDRHVYARENGWAIHGLLALYAAGGDAVALHDARAAAEWILAHRALPGGGFRHGEADAAGPYLGDTLAMGRAFLELYAATSERKWLAHAEAAAGFIARTFGGKAGYLTARPRSAFDRVTPQREENVQVARFGNLLAHYAGNAGWRAVAERGMRFAAAAGVAEDNPAAVLLADDELARDPLHLTVVGPRGDVAARALFAAALGVADPYKRVEFWDPRDGPLPQGYPVLEKPAAFVCTGDRCSRPAFTPAELRRLASRDR